MKFQVGDKVRILDGSKLIGNKSRRVTTGKTYEIYSTHEKDEKSVEHIKVVDNFGNHFNICDWEYKYIEIVSTKQSKNQRITALEKEVERIPVLEKEVAELKLVVEDLRERKEIETVEPATPESIADWEVKLKSANQQRAEIIEKAKKFVEEAINQGKEGSPISDLGNETYQYKFYDVEFEVEENKVQATVYQTNNKDKRLKKEPLHITVSNCHPKEVFNEHIGKAIALGRALVLDVSEFEQAVQPDEVVVGMTIRRKFWDSDKTYLREVKKVKGEYMDYECGGYDSSIHPQDNLTIINDTNAQYEEVK